MKLHVSNNLKVLANICFNFDKKRAGDIGFGYED